MANFSLTKNANSFDNGYDMSIPLFFTDYSFVTEQTSKRIIINFGNNEDTYIGNNFSFSGDLNEGGKVTGGIITKIISKFEGKSMVVLSQLDTKVEAVKIYQEVVENDAQGTFSYILRGNDLITGAKRGDTLIGYTGNDKIIGKEGDDKLFGSEGNDILNGYGEEKGELDYLTGGKGKDIFVLGDRKKAFYTGDGSKGFATIKDFDSREGDEIRFHGNKNDYEFQQFSGETNIFLKGDLIGRVKNFVDVDYKAIKPKWNKKKKSLRVGFEVNTSNKDQLTNKKLKRVKVGLFYGSDGEIVGDELTGLRLGKPVLKRNRVFYNIDTKNLPLNFTDKQLETNQIVVKVDPNDEVLETNENNNQDQTADFFIRRIPQIMRNIGKSMKNKGWNKGASFMERWFGGESKILETPKNGEKDFTTNTKIQDVSIKWLTSPKIDSDGRAKAAFDDIKLPGTFLNQPARNALARELALRLKNEDVGTEIKLKDSNKKGKLLHDRHIQTRSVSPSREGSDNSVTLDPLQAAMGRFSFHAVPIGTAKLIKRIPKSRGKEVYTFDVKVDGVTVYALDTYDFNNRTILPEPLGTWTPPNMVEPGWGVTNNDFKKFRENTGIGEDFLVMSDPISYSIDSTAFTVKWEG